MSKLDISSLVFTEDNNSKNVHGVFDLLKIESIISDIETFLNEKINHFSYIEGFTAPIVLKHIDTYARMIFMYMYDKRPFSVAYSGGKDSTVTMDITLRTLLLIKYMYGQKQLKKKTYVMFSDTLLEMDPVIIGILKSIDNIESFGKQYNLKLDVRKVSPSVRNRYYSLLIGKGYLTPRSDLRWCTDRLKVKPQKIEITKILNETKVGFIALTGQRVEEGADRKKRMEQLTIDGSFKQHEFKECNLFAPLEFWTAKEIWNYIYTHKMSWIDAETLGRVYAEAGNDGGECRSLLEGFETGSMPGCSKSARYGCYLCTLFNFDKTLHNLTYHHSYMTHLEDFRNWLVQYRQNLWETNRDVFIHGQHRMKKYDKNNHRKGMQLPGGYNLEFRAEILRKLMETERKVIKERGVPLISDEELAYIQQCWIEDGDLNLTVAEIAYDRKFLHLMDKKYFDVLISLNILKDNSNEWKLLVDENGVPVFEPTKVCNRLFTQIALQLEKAHHKSFNIFNDLISSNITDFKSAMHIINTLPAIKRMNFVSSDFERYLRNEWSNDKIGFITFLELFEQGEIKKPRKYWSGYEGTHGTHFDMLEQFNMYDGDITMCKDISLEDQIRFIENKW